MLLSYEELYSEWKQRSIRFEPEIDPDQITKSSIDLRLGYNFLIPKKPTGAFVDLRPKHIDLTLFYSEKTLQPGETLTLDPEEGTTFVVGFTYEHIYVPQHLAARVETRSWIARAGLQIHLAAPHIHPGWDGHLALEMVWHHKTPLILSPEKTYPCHLIFHRVLSRSI